MNIQAVKLYTGGFMTQPFAFGGGEPAHSFNPSVRYPSCLQNYVIDTGSELILVDTGMPRETPDTPPKEGQPIYPGTRILDYVSALQALGYKPADVSKILVTHKHPDHTGELRSFPHARIYISEPDADALALTGDNIVRVAFDDGPYYNFSKSAKITDHIRMLPAPGHTHGNSIIVAETDGLFYMLHGDITYTDAALRENHLSIVFEDLPAARQSLQQVRTFIQQHPTVYVSTHTPEGYENLEQKKIMRL